MYSEIYESFNTKYLTYVIAYCPDIDSWFISDERHYYFQFDNEFNTFNEARDYFNINKEVILKQTNKIRKQCGQKQKEILYLDDGGRKDEH